MEQGIRAFDAAGARNRFSLAVVGAGVSGRDHRDIVGLLKPFLRPPHEDQDASYRHLQELKQVLGDGTQGYGYGIEPFQFEVPGKTEKVLAYGAGLEGFYFRKVQLERESGPLVAQMPDYFKYLDCLLAPIPRARDLRSRLAALSRQAEDPAAKNAELDSILAEYIGKWQQEVDHLDASRWGRGASIYESLARADGDLQEAMRSGDDEKIDDWLDRRRWETRADTIWLNDIFEIGAINRWGTGGGSPYAIVGYRVKKELGGDESLKRVIARAHRKGLKVMVDFIPNHTALDGDMFQAVPEAFLHIVPPQPEEGEDTDAYRRRILAAVPSTYYLLRAEHYPLDAEGLRRGPKWVLVHHPTVDYGNAVYIDMAQIDYSRPAARRWVKGEMLRLFKDVGVDAVRMDMAYEDLNVRFFPRWKAILARESAPLPEGWVKQAIGRLILDFAEREKRLGGAEFLKEAIERVKKEVPHAFFLAEGYTNFNEMSRAGIDAVYNKADFDKRMGQIGFYDAFQSQDPGRIREALEYIAFRRWQRGAATTMQFPESHDDEGNALDKFGRRFKALMALTLLAYPNLIYNSLEFAVPRAQALLGDLSKSTDNNKAIPFDIPVLINRAASNPPLQEFLRGLWAYGDASRKSAGGVIPSVLTLVQGDPAVAAETIAFADAETRRTRTFLIAANSGDAAAGGLFSFKKPILEKLGAFVPQRDKVYLLKDYAHLKDGQPAAYTRSGAALLDQGLYVQLDGGDVHLFEVEELNAAAPATGPPSGMAELREPLGLDGKGMIDAVLETSASQPGAIVKRFAEGRVAKTDASGGILRGSSRKSLFIDFLRRSNFKEWSWDRWTIIINNLAFIPYFFLQIPQIVMNTKNLAHGHPEMLGNLPWMGYSFGILASLLILPYRLFMKENVQARIDAFSVLACDAVLVQIYLAGIMPLLAFAIILPVSIMGLILAHLNHRGKLSPGLWNRWIRAIVLFGLVMLAPAFVNEFHLMPTYIPAVAGLVVWGGLLLLDHLGRLPRFLQRNWETLSAWIATWLFMFGPVAGLILAIRHPENIVGTSVLGGLLSLSGALLMLPRALHTQDRIWTVGALWSALVGGWLGFFVRWFFGAWDLAYLLALTGAMATYIGLIMTRNKGAHSSIWDSLRFMWTSKPKPQGNVPPIAESVEQGSKLYRLSAPDSDASFTVTELGAKITSLSVAGKEVLQQNKDIAGLGGIPVMMFWPNRIEHGRFVFRGKTYDLNDAEAGWVTKDANGNLLHGMGANVKWSLEGKGVDDGGTFISFSLDAKQYPQIERYFGALKVTLTYRVKGRKLSIETAVLNGDREDRIVGFGFHPLFHGDVWKATLPASSYYRTNEQLIPLVEKPRPVDGTPFDFRSGVSLGDASRHYDHVFTGLQYVDGYARSVLYNEADGIRVIIKQGELLNHAAVWTSGDGYIGFEQQTTASNGFNLFDKGIAEAHPLILAPGQAVQTDMSIEVENDRAVRN